MTQEIAVTKKKATHPHYRISPNDFHIRQNNRFLVQIVLLPSLANF